MLLVEYIVESTYAAFRVRADDQGDRAMGIHVIGAVLGVVLDDEDGGVLPELALAHRLDHAAQRQIVVGDHGASASACRPACRRCDRWARRKMVSRGKLPSFSKRVQFLDEAVGPFLVGIIQIEAAELAGRSVPPAP